MNNHTEQLTLDILLNPSVKSQDEIRLSKQAQKIYKLLLRGEVFTSQMAVIACQYNARLSEIRIALLPFNKTVDLIFEDPTGNNAYKIVQFEGSKYQEHLRNLGKIL